MKKYFMSLALAIALTASVQPQVVSADEVIVENFPASTPISIVNGIDVNVSEFKYYINEAKAYFESVGGPDIWATDFEGRTAYELVKESAINSAEMINVVCGHADEYDAQLTEQEKASLHQEVLNIVRYLSDAEKFYLNISYDTLSKIVSDRIVYSKIYEKITSEYLIDEEAYATFHTENASMQKDYATMYLLKSIAVPDVESAEEIKAKIDNGEDFDTLLMEYDMMNEIYQQTSDLELSKGQLETTLNVPFDLEVDEISDVLGVQDVFYIFKVLEKDVPADAEVDSYLREVFASENQNEYFGMKYQEWEDKAEIIFDDNVYIATSLF